MLYIFVFFCDILTGVFQAAATFSPAIGFLGGGILLDNMYTDLSVEE